MNPTPASPQPGNTGPSAAPAAGDTGHRFERAVGATHEAVDRAAASLENAAQRLRAGYDQACAVEQEWAEHCRTRVRAHPLTSVLGALAAGWLIGALCSRPHR